MPTQLSQGSVIKLPMREAANLCRSRRALLRAGASGGAPFLDLRDGVFHGIEDEER
jgi:hypothetical protein